MARWPDGQMARSKFYWMFRRRYTLTDVAASDDRSGVRDGESALRAGAARGGGADLLSDHPGEPAALRGDEQSRGGAAAYESPGRSDSCCEAGERASAGSRRAVGE